MSAHAMLAAQDSRRQEQRYVFRRRGLMTTDEATLQIRTVDVSAHGLAVMSPSPIKAGKLCSIMLDAVIGARIVQLHFSCKAIYCILAGTEGFRTSLYIDGNVDTHKQQLQKIIATCSSASLAASN
ncbi:PilZ domain-containing protein [Herminiimonas fonticola]|uniref:PilZ domain-containing protein n=1 Tax=Herminiimonas fonticola TaxID=303380 RepID=A0A4R6G5T0_9BURK|nr:PilZ domain-containing protein [Herminiimonas fonticola]RBA23879.1 PilZ domain [Herminiimonas fonticola]TDN89879.1 PilZ domain-containing protein [Herminiimonas fonticola]